MVDERLRFAITNKRLVKLSYGESVRVVESHDYGVQKGVARLLAYQQQSFGPKKSEPGWRSDRRREGRLILEHQLGRRL